MVHVLQLIAPLVLSLGAPSWVEASLSIPPTGPGYTSSTRASEIAQVASQLQNGDRSIPIGGVQYPFFYGPLPGPLVGSYKQQELVALRGFGTTYSEYMARLATIAAPTLTSMEAIADLYNQASGTIEKPMSMDNSDETFGLERHTIKAQVLREATLLDLDGKPLSLTSQQLSQLCGQGATEKTLLNSHFLFVEQFANVSQYNDKAKPFKYIPDVVGFFCVHKAKKKLLPIEIRLLQTNLVYTPFDEADDWTLAKMALQRASVVVHQWKHMADTHSVTIPLHVELMRTMGSDHPVRALLLRHMLPDLALDVVVVSTLLSAGTAHDLSFGWGASGAARFLSDLTTHGTSIKDKAFPTDILRRGLQRIPGHKYVAYGRLYWDAINRFVTQYTNAYYPSDRAIENDVELQNWAQASIKIPQIHDFPSAFKCKDDLVKVLTFIIFEASVKHHAMNSAAGWQGFALPYSGGALWKPLPQTKGQKLNLIQYTTPPTIMPAEMAMAALFIRPVPASASWSNAYSVEPFASETKLTSAITWFKSVMEGIETTITQQEKDEKWPFLVVSPSRMPCLTWI